MERGFGTCEVEWTGKVETKKFLAEGEPFMAIPGFKWRIFDNSGGGGGGGGSTGFQARSRGERWSRTFKLSQKKS